MHFFKHLLSFLLTFPLFASAQQWNEYRPIVAQNPIPQEFITLPSEKYAQAKEQRDSIGKGNRVKQTENDFLLESNFLVDQVLSSGRVLFNDPVSEYLNRIMDLVLVKAPELRKQVRVYALRSSEVNSFTTDDGIILVNLGLLAQLENEAQLAFILCHELAHYTEKHVINAYVENEEIKQQRGVYRRSTFDERMLARSRYSKALEKDADRLGLERFLSTNYSTSSLLNVFEVMRYAHLPFDDIAFDKTFFNEAYYKVDDSYFLNRVRPVEPLGSEGGKNNSHPSPTERQKLMHELLGNSLSVSDKQYLVSKIDFERLRELARFELSSLYLKSNRPVMSIYNTYLLLRKHPQSQYLKKTVATALYTLSKFKSGGNFGYVHPGFSHIEGESQQAFHLFYRLEPEELCVLATGHLWRLRSIYPKDKDIIAMSDDLLNDLMTRYYVPGMFAKIKPAVGWNTPDTTTAIMGKYDRLKQKSKDNPRLSMIEYALVDLFGSPTFSTRFDELERENWGGDLQHISEKKVEKKTRDDLRYWKNHGFALGAKKVVVVSPTYSKLDMRKKQNHRFLRSESAKHRLMDRIRNSSDLLGLELQMLEASELDPDQAEEFNDIVFLNEWVDARFLQADANMINLDQDRITTIIEKYGTENFVWTGVINYHESKELRAYFLLYLLMPPALPFAVYNVVKPDYDTYYYCITFNLRTGEPTMVDYNNFNKRDAKDLINSSIYDSFWQMKRQPRKRR
ncbi:MAG: M48 family metallopeptidase [Flavobacteriales bacterium]|nr:M48 family metallopeptidase [Flavobacteriales bacterium]